MPDGATFTVFLVAAFTLLVIPGPAVLFVVTRSIEHGRLVGIASVLGVATGGIVHVAGAAFGISALLVQSAVAFTAVKLAGAGYLIWLGLRRIVAPPEPVTTGPDRDEPGRRRLTAGQAFRQGIVVNVLNPKVALFFLAFLPQFIDASKGTTLLQTLALGFTFLGLGVVTDGTYAIAAGTVGDAVRKRVRRPKVGARLAGVVYLGLGISALFTRRTATT